MEQAIADEIEQEFRISPYHQLRNVKCELHGDVLTLRGRVNSFYLKQQAQVVAKNFARGGEVRNQIEVTDGDD